MRIALANSKGGVGKSTTTVILADYLAFFHQLKVLVIDLDPQATTSCLLKSVTGLELARQQRQTLTHYLDQLKGGLTPTLADFRQVNVSNLVELQPMPQAGRAGRIDLIASVPSLWFAEQSFVERYYSAGGQPTQQLFTALSTGLEQLAGQYDVVLIDCPPNYSSLTQAGLLLADTVISPTTADEIALMSLKDFSQNALGRFQDRHFVLVTRLGRTKDEADQLANIRRNYTMIGPPMHYSTKIARAMWFLAPNSRKTYKEKYGSFLKVITSDIEAIGKAVYDHIIDVKARTTYAKP
jgi:chromosome partitioning protein